MLNFAVSVLDISCVFGIQDPFQLWNMFFFISDHRGGKNVNIVFRHFMRANSITHAVTAFISFQYSGHECYSKSTRGPGDTDN